MSRERRWWGVPRSFAGFSLWRLSNPFDTGEEAEAKEATARKRSEVREPTPKAEQSLTIAKEKSRSLSVEKSPARRRLDRSRSRSSSFSFKSRKSAERATSEEHNDVVDTAEVRKSTMPDISFTFFSEQDREDEFVVVDPAVKTAPDTDNNDTPATKRRSEIICTLENNRPDGESDGERSRSEEDERVKRVMETEDPEKTEVRHVSSVVLTMKPADYSNVYNDVNIAVESVVKEHEYEVLKERTEPQQPTSSETAVECIPVYASVDKSQSKLKSTVQDNYSPRESLEDLPSILSVDKNSLTDSITYKDCHEKLPAIPQPDWDELSEHSEYNADYAELTTPVQTPEPTEHMKPDPEVKGAENMEYCQHRAELKPSRRRVTLLRCKKTVKRTPSIGRVKNKLGKAWKKVRGWWIEERIRLNDVILKRDSVREASVVSDLEECRGKCRSEEDVYAGLEDLEVRSVDDVVSCATMPNRHLRRYRARSPTPVLSRSSSIAAFRRSRFFPEVRLLNHQIGS